MEPCSLSASASTLGASGGSPRPGAPAVSSSRHCPSSRPSAITSARKRGVTAARLAKARPVVTSLPVPTWLASTPEPTTFSAAISFWRPSRTGSSASGRARVMRTTWRAPASSVTRAPERLSARSPAIACSATTTACGGAHPVGAGDGEHPGPPLHAAHTHRVLEVSGRLGGQQQRQAALDGGLHCLSQVHHRARLGVALGQRSGAEPSLGELARRERDDPQRELAAPPAVAAGVACAADEQPAPAVAFVAGCAHGYRLAEGARELLRELRGRVQALLRPCVQAVAVDPLQQLVGGVGRQRRRGEIAAERPSEGGDQAD